MVSIRLWIPKAFFALSVQKIEFIFFQRQLSLCLLQGHEFDLEGSGAGFPEAGAKQESRVRGIVQKASGVKMVWAPKIRLWAVSFEETGQRGEDPIRGKGSAFHGQHNWALRVRSTPRGTRGLWSSCLWVERELLGYAASSSNSSHNVISNSMRWNLKMFSLTNHKLVITFLLWAFQTIASWNFNALALHYLRKYLIFCFLKENLIESFYICWEFSNKTTEKKMLGTRAVGFMRPSNCNVHLFIKCSF